MHGMYANDFKNFKHFKNKKMKCKILSLLREGEMILP